MGYAKSVEVILNKKVSIKRIRFKDIMVRKDIIAGGLPRVVSVFKELQDRILRIKIG